MTDTFESECPSTSKINDISDSASDTEDSLLAGSQKKRDQNEKSNEINTLELDNIIIDSANSESVMKNQLLKHCESITQGI